MEFTPKSLADLNIDAVLPLGGGNGSSDGLANGGRFFATHKSNHPSNAKYNNNNKNIDNNNTTTTTKHHNQQTNNNNLLNSNNNHHNINNQYNTLFSSQQNLAKTNIIQTSNITRSRIYGSQQSLSTVSNHSSTNSINNTKTPPFYQLQPHQLQHQQQSNSHNNLLQGYNQINSNNTNSHNNHLIIDNNQSPTDVWLNAWNSPPSSATTTTRNSSSSSTLDMFSAPSINNHSSQITTSSSSNFNYRINNTINSNTTTNSTTSQQYQHTSTNSNHFNNFNSQNGLFSDPWTGEFYYLFILFDSLL